MVSDAILQHVTARNVFCDAAVSLTDEEIATPQKQGFAMTGYHLPCYHYRFGSKQL